MKDNIIIIIPAYNPNYILEELVENLQRNGYTKIIVINDGSKQQEIFNKIRGNAIILTHEKNLGKGTALKTGIKYCLENFKDFIGVITVDADGQHLIKDINKIYAKLCENPNKLILGSRNFKDKNIPFRSLIGNRFMRLIFKIKTGTDIYDTQTGLRGISKMYLNDFYGIDGYRYEYETNVLLYAVKRKIKIIQEPIECIYLNNNKASHFKAIRDSKKIILRVFGL